MTTRLIQPSPTELVIPSADGMPLHARAWEGREARGTLIISHGMGEHGGCYTHVAEALAATPGLVDVLSFDYRGHGQSPGRRGMVRRYEELVDDLRAAVAWAGERRPDRPRFVLGHSNGGQVALRLARSEPPEIDGLILSNPALQLLVPVPRHKLWAGRVLRLLAPRVTLGSTLADEMMTSDAEMIARRKLDQFRHARVNPTLFFGMVEGGARLIADAEAIRLPVLLILGQADPVVDASATRRAFERFASPDKTLRAFPEMRHEPLNEVGRARVLDAIKEWLAPRLP